MQENFSKNYKVITIDLFDKQVKRLIKKYPSLINEFETLLNQLESNPFQGDPIGHDCFKIRIAIASKGKGKSGGGRVITNVVVSDKSVFLLTIYDKSETESVSEKTILELLKSVQK